MSEKQNNKKPEHTLRMAGSIELGPLDEKSATFVPTGCPTSVLEGCIFTTGNLKIIYKSIKILMHVHICS